MNAMESSSFISWTMAHPDAATALATMALVAVGLVIGLGQIGVVFYGIWKMAEGNKARAEQHREAMDAETNRHKESMDTEAKRHEEAMKALAALIRNTAPGPAPAA